MWHMVEIVSMLRSIFILLIILTLQLVEVLIKSGICSHNMLNFNNLSFQSGGF